MRSVNRQADSPEVVLEKHISVRAAAGYSGYNIQYLRRLLRNDRLQSIKIGQIWLIAFDSFEGSLHLNVRPVESRGLACGLCKWHRRILDSTLH